MTIPRENRLFRTKEIKEVFERGKRGRGKLLSVHWLKKEDTERKMAVILRKQKKATERNRMRRIIKEAYRLLLPHFSSGHHIVILPAPGALERLKKVKTQDIKEELEKILRKIGILQ